jgi:peptidoglycan/xylan/chitin deacetylase (PgdA/CDA1 family)
MTAREHVSRIVRMLIAHGLHSAGVLHLLRLVLLRRKAIVLMYHRVLTEEQRARTASQQGLVVDRETFARQIAFLKRFFRVLTLDEFADHLATRTPFDGPCCLITFDDGWIDNFQNALPVLAEHNVPAVVFLPVNFVGRGRLFTREALTHLLVRTVQVCREEPERRKSFRALLAPLGLDRVLDVTDPDPLPAVRRALGVHRYASGPEFQGMVAAVSAELGLDGDDSLSDLDTFVDWSQVHAMAQRGVSFGGHGADHVVLTHVDAKVARCEVETSKRTLDARLRRPVRAFAYPNGAWNAEIADAVKASGYQLAFTTEAGPVSCDDDPYSLRRVNIHEGMTRSTPMFLARLTGLF